MTYEPRPIPTDGIELPERLRELGEALARNTHDHWAALRLAHGWTQGERRDDERRTHPSLVPYEDLPESEKELDRATSRETLKAILALGFEIVPPEDVGRNP